MLTERLLSKLDEAGTDSGICACEATRKNGQIARDLASLYITDGDELSLYAYYSGTATSEIGGDTNIVGTMIGALLGATQGQQAIDNRLAEFVYRADYEEFGQAQSERNEMSYGFVMAIVCDSRQESHLVICTVYINRRDSFTFKIKCVINPFIFWGQPTDPSQLVTTHVEDVIVKVACRKEEELFHFSQFPSTVGSA
ncbi:unnamed protein product [Didymodactylos carnosus]|uniref:Uncharacterized protein n=1 Tax=Didymodactylos carnosus TaxID=1234261 RepID=A0A813VRM0_9BILA|nr:unnamed protein product [Didymodactylos carnosus]CAF0847160.1 unnamed protein product [Didymodactylos carnosus]CAF3606136.1 unnamed protein product [Didymodactylos carnosus]CAF3634805.1 unnamed protein product [Didymodactylos carnosus]